MRLRGIERHSIYDKPDTSQYTKVELRMFDEMDQKTRKRRLEILYAQRENGLV